MLAGSLAVAACGGSESTETKTDTGSADGAVDDTGMGVLYGGSPDTGSADTGPRDATSDTPSDAAKDGDGGPDDTGGPAPKYGAPPPPDGG